MHVYRDIYSRGLIVFYFQREATQQKLHSLLLKTTFLYRMVHLERTYRDYQVQLLDHFAANLMYEHTCSALV